MKKEFRTPVAMLALFSLVVALLIVLGNGVVSAGDAVERPFRMQTYGYVVDEGPHAGDCSFATVIAEEHGVATHMGAVNVSRTHCFSPFNNPPIYDGEWEAVGADGDKVYGTYEGSLTFTEFDANGDPIRGTIDSQFTITGGTGRFQGATGGGSVSADYDLVADAGNFITEGTITY
jgi:hypothetical protein